MSKIQDFTTIKKLGDGAFSSVFLVKKNSDGAQYAMKKVKMGKLSGKEKENALNEVRILASIQHTNIIGYKDCFFENAAGNLCIIMEVADNGDLLQLIEKAKKQRTKMSEKQIWHYFVQMVRGLKALHDLRICHRDIKCANLFLTKDGMVKMGDLNVSKVAKKGMMHTQTGTPYYASPEVWLDKPYDNKSDIWSLGCVLYEMITLMPPFRATSMAELSRRVTRGTYDPIPANFSSDLAKIVKMCLQVKPSNRPTCNTLLETPGLLNHITSSLEQINLINEKEDTDSQLLATIKCPRVLGMITDRLPKPQYQPKLNRSKSMAIETNDRFQEEQQIPRNPLLVNKSIENLTAQKKLADRANQYQARRPQQNLPTIQEDNVDDEIVDSNLGLIRRKNQKNIPKSVRHSQIAEKGQLKQHRRNLSNLEDLQLLNPQSRDRYSNANPKSADLYSNKAKAKGLNSQISNSDQEDATTEATRVSSGQSQSRAAKKNLNAQYYGYDYRTPQIQSSKASQLPQIKSRARLVSLDPPQSLYSQYENQQVSYHRRNDSQGMSRALGGRNDSSGMSRALGGMGGPGRYSGVGQALRLARDESQENMGRNANYNPSSARGPCPKYLQQSPSMHRGIVQDADLKSLQDLHRGLQDVYRQRRVQPDPASRYRQHQQQARELSALYERIV